MEEDPVTRRAASSRTATPRGEGGEERSATKFCEKFRKKYARVNVVVSGVRQKFRPKKTFYLTCVKKTKI